MSWWVISDGSLMEMLHRVSLGESPDMIYAEYYANCQHEEVAGDGEGEEESA